MYGVSLIRKYLTYLFLYKIFIRLHLHGPLLLTVWVNPSKRGGMDGVFRGLAGLLRGISRGQSPRKIPRSSPASPRKTLSIPTLLLGFKFYLKLVFICSSLEDKKYGNSHIILGIGYWRFWIIQK